VTFKWETDDDLVLKSLSESIHYLDRAATSLSRVNELISEYKLWRLLSGEVHEIQSEAKHLSLKVAGCIEFIERELPVAAQATGD